MTINNPPQFPHCDAKVLHAPGECQYCDKHSDWQALRVYWGIAFTGHVPAEGQIPCPAEFHRSVDTINLWGGNVPNPEVGPRCGECRLGLGVHNTDDLLCEMRGKDGF